MIKLIVIVFAIIGLMSVLNGSNSPERAVQAAYSAQRNESQDEILAKLQAMRNVGVSEFVADWRTAFAQPTPEQLSELRSIEQQIENDQAAAIKFTREYKMKNDPMCTGQMRGVLSYSEPDCPPGL